MVKITKDMRKKGMRTVLEKYESMLDEKILAATDRGDHRVVFPLDQTDPYFYELRDRYEANGYKIMPVGVIGGVKQRDYWIMW